jgi:hypothetical protein
MGREILRRMRAEQVSLLGELDGNIRRKRDDSQFAGELAPGPKRPEPDFIRGPDPAYGRNGTPCLRRRS